jgi:hypothetical protein
MLIKGHSFRTLFFGLLFLLVGLLFLGINAMNNLSSEKPILKICVTGNVQSEQMQWKQPDGPLTLANVTCHEVILETPGGDEVARLFLPGDLVAIRAKTFLFPPLLAAMGIKTKYRLDLIYSGYRRAEDYTRLPVRAQPLESPTSGLSGLLFKYWESFFVKNTHLFFVKTATLESQYFPLTDEEGNPLAREFMLTLSPFGLSHS